MGDLSQKGQLRENYLSRKKNFKKRRVEKKKNLACYITEGGVTRKIRAHRHNSNICYAGKLII